MLEDEEEERRRKGRRKGSTREEAVDAKIWTRYKELGDIGSDITG